MRSRAFLRPRRLCRLWRARPPPSSTRRSRASSSPRSSPSRSLSGMSAMDEVDELVDGVELAVGGEAGLEPERLLDEEDQVDRVEGVQAQGPTEAGRAGDLLGRDG